VNEEAVYSIFNKPRLKKPVMVVAWSEDASNIGIRAADYLIDALKCRELGEILPDGFFTMSGVNVMDNVAQFPESKFYVSDDGKVIILKSSIPRVDWHRFLTALLEIAKKECGVAAIFTIGAMISVAAHTSPRVLISVVNNQDLKAELEPFDVMCNTDYENPAGQKPTLSSYLLWLARQKDITAAALWVPVPYYMVSVDDPRACKRIVSFFNSKLNLDVDFTGLDGEISVQNSRISTLYARLPEIEGFVHKLEAGESLESEESEKLLREITDLFKNN
jgi:predicted ATP-grasp superfamily ATP-dependent carboligase